MGRVAVLASWFSLHARLPADAERGEGRGHPLLGPLWMRLLDGAIVAFELAGMALHLRVEIAGHNVLGAGDDGSCATTPATRSRRSPA